MYVVPHPHRPPVLPKTQSQSRPEPPKLPFTCIPVHVASDCLRHQKTHEKLLPAQIRGIPEPVMASKKIDSRRPKRETQNSQKSKPPVVLFKIACCEAKAKAKSKSVATQISPPIASPDLLKATMSTVVFLSQLAPGQMRPFVRERKYSLAPRPPDGLIGFAITLHRH